MLRCVVAMLQMAAAVSLSHLRGNSTSDADPCDCYKWTDVYTTLGGQCGDAEEFFSAMQSYRYDAGTRSLLAKHMGPEFCTNFFEKLNTNICVNVNMGEDKGQWCYVSENCKQLGGGESVRPRVWMGGPFHLSWKTCQEGRDTMLRQKSPEELAGFAVQKDLDLGLLHKMSYPLSTKRFQEYEGYFFLENKTPASLSAHQLTEIKDIVATGKPMSFDFQEDHHPPHVIVQGSRVYGVLGGLHCVMNCQ